MSNKLTKQEKLIAAMIEALQDERVIDALLDKISERKSVSTISPNQIWQQELEKRN